MNVLEDIDFAFPEDTIYYVEIGKPGVVEVYVNEYPSGVEVMEEICGEYDTSVYQDYLSIIITEIKRFKERIGTD